MRAGEAVAGPPKGPRFRKPSLEYVIGRNRIDAKRTASVRRLVPLEQDSPPIPRFTQTLFRDRTPIAQRGIRGMV